MGQGKYSFLVTNNKFALQGMIGVLSGYLQSFSLTVCYIFLGKLTLKIPWKNLYSEAVVATLDGLYLLVVPEASKF